MGLSTTISTAFFALILISGSAYLIALNMDMMKSTSEPLDNFADIAYIQLSEDCQIDSWNNQTLHTLDLNITNTGDLGIRVFQFNDIDVILSCTTSGGIVNTWLTYDQDKPSSNHWSVSSVFTSGETGDTVNPINLSGNIYGIWDPGETIEIRIYISDDVQSFNFLKISLPYGSTTCRAM